MRRAIHHSKRHGWQCLAAVVLSVCAGCGQETTISGIVLLDGKPLKISEEMKGTVLFQPANRQGPTLNGIIDAQGQYKLGAGSMTSVPTGVYLATVSAVEVYQSDGENPQPEGHRITPRKYSKSDESGLRVKIEPGTNSVVLELLSEPTAQETSTAEHAAEDIATDEKETESEVDTPLPSEDAPTGQFENPSLSESTN